MTDASSGGFPPGWLEAEVERALAPFKARVSTDDLAFMREELLVAAREGALKTAARRSAPRQTEESGAAPLDAHDAEVLRRALAKGRR